MKVEIEALPPAEYSLNWRGHPIERYRAGKVYRHLVFYRCIDVRNLAMRQPGGWVPFQVAILDLTFIFRDHRERDEDNLRARFKPGQDSLVQAGLIQTDTQKHLILGKIEIVVDPARAPLTIIELKEQNYE